MNLSNKLTSLNESRPHVTLPKTTNLNGFCTITMNIGSIFCTSDGKQYESNRLTISSISLNAKLARSPVSFTKKIMANDQSNSNTKSIIKAALFSFCSWFKKKMCKYCK